MKRSGCFINKYFHDQKGISLVELIIFLALLPLVLMLGFMFLSFGASTFDTGEKQVDIQQNARLAADFITKELRIAERVIILDSHEDYADLDIDAEEDYYLYYIYNEGGNIYYEKVGESESAVAIQAVIAEKVDFDLTFSLSDESNILSFDLKATEKESGRSHLLETEVLVLNLNEIEEQSDGTGRAVFYQVPAPPKATLTDIRLNSHSHEFVDEEVRLEVSVFTSNVDDETTVTPSFLHLDEDGIETKVDDVDVCYEEATVKIVNDKASFSFILPAGLEYGDYSVSIDVEGIDFPQRRFYYINQQSIK